MHFYSLNIGCHFLDGFSFVEPVGRPSVDPIVHIRYIRLLYFKTYDFYFMLTKIDLIDFIKYAFLLIKYWMSFLGWFFFCRTGWSTEGRQTEYSFYIFIKIILTLCIYKILTKIDLIDFNILLVKSQILMSFLGRLVKYI